MLANDPLAIQEGRAYSELSFANELNFTFKKLCAIHARTQGSGREMCLDRVFINQALNTLNNYGARASHVPSR